MTTLLCILDGLGMNPDSYGNAVCQAKTPNLTKLWNENPHATLVTHGERVGLPAGQMGNSEVGHMNIGAGRVVEQWLAKINRELRQDLLPTNVAYKNFLTATKDSKQLHLFGLCSNGGVHSHYEHLLLMLKRLRKDTPATIIVHCITDGRDTPPESSPKFVARIEEALLEIGNAHIGSIVGRFYAMDRDKRWDRIKLAYDLYTMGEGLKFTSSFEALKASHDRGGTDEFIEPVSLGAYTIHPSDGFLFWNLREDRVREIVSALCIENFSGFERSMPIPKRDTVLCFTEYDHTFKLPYLFEPQPLNNHLGETVSKAGLKQIRIAETEKYPHVTYFMNSGTEPPYPGEDRKMAASPRDVKTYDEKPEMAAFEITEMVLSALEAQYDLIVVNYANCDMVGHSGNLEAAVKAVETVDTCLGTVMAKLNARGGNAVIIADHGNAELMINYSDETPYTAHTTFPVPIIVTGSKNTAALLDDGALCDVAPTVLALLKIPQPAEMTGRSLLK